MDSKVVSKAIRTEIRPVLADLGFSHFSTRNAWRYHDSRVDVVNFQSWNAYNAGVLGITTYSFQVNLGCIYSEIPDPDSELKVRNGMPEPQEYQCPFRCSLRRGLRQAELTHDHIWFIDEAGRYLEPVMRDVRDAITRDVAGWFERLATPERALGVLLHADRDGPRGDIWGFGNPNSPHRNYLIGYFALQLGQTEVARSHLSAVLASSSYTRLHDDIRAAIGGAG